VHRIFLLLLTLPSLPLLQENQSSFNEALNHWRELNLTTTFINFAGQTNGISRSMALLLHHWKEVVDFWLAAMSKADDESFRPLLKCATEFFPSLILQLIGHQQPSAKTPC
jgi:hypothetical protein